MKKTVFIFVLLLNSTITFCQHAAAPEYIVKTNINYISGDTLKADIYLPASYKNQKNAALIFIDGFGGDFRKLDHYTGWAKFAATQGFVSILYSSRQGYIKPAFEKLVDFIYANAGKYFIDTSRLAVYAGSGNVPEGLPLANSDTRVKAALIFYGPAKIDSFRLDMPVLLIRAGLDNVQLNQMLDSLAHSALAANAPYTIVNLNTKLHAFEDFSDSSNTAQLLLPLINFLKENMGAHAHNNFLLHGQEVIGAREMYKGNWQASLQAYTRALQFSPGNDETERQLGNICIELKDYEKALQYYDSSLAHGNWRKGEIARKKLLAYAVLNNSEAAVKEIRFLKTIGFFKEADYVGKEEYRNVLNSEAYKKYKDEKEGNK